MDSGLVAAICGGGSDPYRTKDIMTTTVIFESLAVFMTYCNIFYVIF